MPWQASGMGIRLALAAVAVLALAGCSGDDPGAGPGDEKTTDADCAARIPDHVFDTLGWSSPKAAEATVRGCHREAEQGYVELRDRTGDYDRLCQTLDRSGQVGPGTPADWLDDVTACAVEPSGDVGQTKVLVKGSGELLTQITVVVVSSTDQAKVRGAVQQLVD